MKQNMEYMVDERIGLPLGDTLTILLQLVIGFVKMHAKNGRQSP